MNMDYKGMLDESSMSGSTIQHMVRVIRIELDLLIRMGWLVLDLPKESLRSGNAALRWKDDAKHRDSSEESRAYYQMFQTAKTVKDVWDFFLRANNLPEDILVHKPGYDHEYVQTLLKQEISQARHYFCLNKEDSFRKPF